VANELGLRSKVVKLPGHVDGRGIQVSISQTFYEQLLRQNPFAKKLQTLIVST